MISETKRSIIPEDLVDIRGVSDVQVSPDGRQVAFVVTEPASPKDPEKPRASGIWVVPTDGSEPARKFTAGIKSDISPRWSPDGRYLAFLSNRGDPVDGEKEAKNQICLLRLDGGEAEQTTAIKGGVDSLKWSPDGTMIAFATRDPTTEEEEKKQKDRDDAIHVDRDYKYSRLWVLTLSDRKIEQVTRQDLHITSFDWSPDGREFALTVSATPRMDDMAWHSALVIVRRLTGEVLRTLGEHVAWNAEWSPDGQEIAFLQYTPTMIAHWLALAPAGGGPVRHLLKDYKGTIGQIKWEPDSKHLLAESYVGTKTRPLRIDTATEEVTVLAEGLMPGMGFSSLSADGRTIAYLSQAPDAPENIWVIRSGESPRRLTDLHPQTAALNLGEVREITWQNQTDGQPLYGALITPPDFKPGQPCPMIVQPHGGPKGAWLSGWHGSWHNWGQWLASHGYAVFLPNPRGSTGQEWQFVEANRDDWGGMDFRDIMDGVDALIEQQIADPDRLGVGGWSYGGFMTSWTITHTDRFKAAVVGAAVTNLFSFNGTTDITPSFLRNYFLDLPFSRRDAYESHSPTTFLHNCKTPSLILHGQADDRVPAGQGWEFYNGLKALGVETEMVVYPREPHGIGERAHQIDLLKRVLEWFDRYLKRQEA